MGTAITYEPRARIYGHRIASPLKAVHKALTGADFFREAGGALGRRVNVRRVRLSNDPTADRDLAPGQTAKTPYVLLPGYGIRWYSIEPTNFVQHVGPRELELRAEARAILETERLALQSKTKPTDDERRRLDTIAAQLAQLADDGQGYVNTVYDCMGTKAKGVWYGLAAPDVPLDWEYAKSIRPGRSLSFRLKRLEATQGQGLHEYALVFGNDRTRYALVFGKDKEIEWRHYRPMSKATREGLELQLAQAQDAGRLTAADEKTLAGYDAEHAAVKEAAKGKKPDAAQAARLAELKRLEDRLREGKKQLTDAGRALAEEITKRLYYDVATVAVPEFVKTTIGVAIDITIEWLRKGGVLITVGNNEPFTWWNPLVKKTKKYGQLLERGSRLRIRSTGGKWSLAMGAPVYERGLLFGAPYSLAPGANGLVQFIADASPGPLVARPTFWETDPDPDLPGARVAAQVFVIRPERRIEELGVTIPAVYQTRLELATAGDYAPEVHNLELLIAPVVPAIGPLIHDSAQAVDAAGVSHLIDLQTAALEGNSVEARLTYRDGLLPDGGRESGLPALSLVGRVCDVTLVDPASGQEHAVAWRGRIIEDSYDNLQSLAAGTGVATETPEPGSEPDLAPMPNAYSERTLTVVGLEQVANKLADAQVSVNGLSIGEALRLYGTLAGLQPEELQALPETNPPGVDSIPLAPAGEMPTAKPDDTTTYLEFMRRLVTDHAPTYDLATGGQGLYLRSLEEVDRPDLNYSEDEAIDSDLRLLRGLKLVQSLEGFANRVVVIGAEDEETKTRVQVVEALPQSTDRRYEGRSLVYVGEDIPYVYGPNDSIEDETQATVVCRELLDKKGRPPLYGHLIAPYRPDVDQGTLLYVKGKQYLVERKERGHINSGEGIQVMTMYVRVAKDSIKEAA